MAKHTIILPFGDGRNGHAAFKDATAGSKNHWRHVAAVRLQNMNTSSARLTVVTFNPLSNWQEANINYIFIFQSFFFIVQYDIKHVPLFLPVTCTKSGWPTQPQIATRFWSTKPILMNSLKHTAKDRHLSHLLIKIFLALRTWTKATWLTVGAKRLGCGRPACRNESHPVSSSSGGKMFVCFDAWTHPLDFFPTLPPLSDLPPHRFPDAGRWRALACHPGNRCLFHQSWPRWRSPC